MRPIPELPASAELIGPSGVHAKLRLVDVSVGGIAFSRADTLLDAEPGTRMSLRVSLSHYGEHDITVDVRWCADALVGVQYVELTRPATVAVRAYVAELLERGAPS